MKHIRFGLVVCLLGALLPAWAQNFSVTYDEGRGVKAVNTVPWQVDRVANARHNAEPTSVASFEAGFTKPVKVHIVINGSEPIQQVRVRPLSYNIQPVVNGREITFSLDRPRNLSVEINGDIFHNLHLFANRTMAKPRKNKHLIYFGPGEHRLEGDSLAVPSGYTVFIDKDAVVKGFLSVWHAHDVKILGTGIVDPGHHEGIMVRYSKNVLIDGPFTTQIPVGESDSVTIRNAKVMSWYGWGDGMNVFASNHVHYENVFCRTSDDCSTIYCTRKGYHGGCRDIRVDGAVYWADVAHVIMIGLHGDIEKNEVIEDVVYNDVDVLDHAENQIDYQGVFGINNGDNILVRNVTFQNIRVEDFRRGNLFNLRVCYNKKYCHAPGRGIEDVTFRNISYNGENASMSIIAGYDSTRRVSGIHFENLSINGQRIYDTMPEKPKWYKTSDFANTFVGEHVENVTYSETDK